MNKSFNTLIGALLIAGASQSFAASSVDLTVRGLITPSACEPSLSNGGVYDIGKISAKDLNADTPTNLPQHILQVTVTCDAATLMALEAQDNRAGTSYDVDPSAYGLGLINGNEKLGWMLLRLYSPVADGVAGRIIGSFDGGVTWAREMFLQTDNILSVADGTTDVPLPVQVLTADLYIDPRIAPASGLTLNQEVNIDGSATLTVKYL